MVAVGSTADAALRDLARRLERSLLSVAMTDVTVWAWLGSPRRSDPHQLKDLVWAREDDTTRYAAGEPSLGIAGFRESHEQALAASRGSARLAQPVTRYDDVALEAAMLSDVRTARRFVERELGPLTARDPKITVLRETLGTYLDSGLNAAAAAPELHVSDRTVAYRIHGIEELLGRSVLGRSTELAAAVRLHRILST